MDGRRCLRGMRHGLCNATVSVRPSAGLLLWARRAAALAPLQHEQCHAVGRSTPTCVGVCLASLRSDSAYRCCTRRCSLWRLYHADAPVSRVFRSSFIYIAEILN